jgi:cobalt/nickel transport system permease protein
VVEEIFARGGSPVHKIDPRVRVAAGAAFSIVTALAQHFAVLWAALAMGALLALAARLPAAPLFKRMLYLNFFILFLWAVAPLTFPGPPLFSVGPLAFARDGVLLCAKATLKANAIALFSFAAFTTMPMAKLGHALHRLKAPPKLVHLVLMCHRYVFVISREYQEMRRAAALRGFAPRPDMRTWRTYAWLVGMLFVRAHARAARVHQAMLCRGFTGVFHCLDTFRFRPADTAWAALFSLAVLGLAVAEFALS